MKILLIDVTFWTSTLSSVLLLIENNFTKFKYSNNTALFVTSKAVTIAIRIKETITLKSLKFFLGTRSSTLSLEGTDRNVFTSLMPFWQNIDKVIGNTNTSFKLSTDSFRLRKSLTISCRLIKSEKRFLLESFRIPRSPCVSLKCITLLLDEIESLNLQRCFKSILVESTANELSAMKRKTKFRNFTSLKNCKFTNYKDICTFELWRAYIFIYLFVLKPVIIATFISQPIKL